MDEAVVTDDDGSDIRSVEKESLTNQDLSFLSESVADVLSKYGWYLLAVTVLVYLLIQHLNRRRSSQSHSRTASPQTQPDPVTVVRRQEAVEAARRRMQEELDAKAAAFKEKHKQQEEEKRKQKIEMWESMQQGKSYKGNAKHSETNEETDSSTAVLKQKTEKKPLRSNDYNPLSGEGGGSCSWRPNRRGQSSGG